MKIALEKWKSEDFKSEDCERRSSPGISDGSSYRN